MEWKKYEEFQLIIKKRLGNVLLPIWRGIDLITAGTGSILAALLLSVIFYTQSKMDLFAIIFGAFIACSIYILIVKYIPYLNEIKTTMYTGEHFSRYSNIVLHVVTILLIAYLMYLSNFYYTEIKDRFLILLIFVGILISIQIFTKYSKFIQFLLIFEIIMYAILPRIFNYYQYSTIQGIDSWGHLDHIEHLIQGGELDDSFGRYQSAPIMHIIPAIISIVSKMTSNNAYFTLCLIEIGLILLAFLLIRQLFSEQIALLSCLLLLTIDSTIYWSSINIIPMAFSILFVSVIEFVMLTDNRKLLKHSPILLAIFILVINFIHPMGAGGIIFLLIIIYIIKNIYNLLIDDSQKIRIELGGTLLLLLIFIIIYHWIYISENFNTAMGFIQLSFELQNFKGLKISDGNFILAFWRNIPLGIFAFFTIIGILTSFNEKNQNKKVFCISKYQLLLICHLLFSVLIFILYILGKNLIIFNRWVIYLYIVLSLPCAIGLLQISKAFSRLLSLNLTITFCIFSAIFFGTMITSDLTNTPSNFQWSDHPRTGILESEIKLPQFISQHIDVKETIYMDIHYINAFESNENKNTIDSSRIFEGKNSYDKGFLALRKEISDHVFYVSNELGLHRNEHIMNHDIFDSIQNGESTNEIYNSGTVFLLHRN